MPLRIGFTGTSEGMSSHQSRIVGKMLTHATQLHHGDCVGSDNMAHQLAPVTCAIVIHPPINESKRAFCHNVRRGATQKIFVVSPKEYLERNHDIVDATDVLIATPKGLGEELRSGTWSTIRYARKQGKVVIIVGPTGIVTREENNGNTES